MLVSESLKRSLNKCPEWFIAVFAAISSFCVYFSMYAFRKPFTAAGFEGIYFLKIDYKVWLVTAQVVGYMFSKFYGIKYISGVRKEKRANAIVTLILISWSALLLFAVCPSPYGIVFLFMNGFPLGMVWGLVFSFLEGRRQTEFMGAVLSITFIFSSGVVKSVGKFLMITCHVSEFWMPFLTGGIFVLPMLFFTWLLNHLPDPNSKDIEMRSIRNPMTSVERKSFLNTFLPGIIMIVSTYVLLTILRDFRDNFANEIWKDIGYGNQAAIFTKTEIPISIIVLLSMSLLIMVKNNFRAFMLNHLIIGGGYLLALITTILFSVHKIDGVLWMILTGTGLYLSYIPFNALYFERMIASYKIKGNIGFVMYIADAFGYLGSVLVLFIKQFLGFHFTWSQFFIDIVLWVCSFGIIGTLLSVFYFRRKYNGSERNLKHSYATA
ncbi:MAG: DUF5690 family protein [Ginsengibacter sp.]